MQAVRGTGARLTLVKTPSIPADPNEHLRGLYLALLVHQECFDEFKQLLAIYPKPEGGADEDTDAAGVRSVLNARIRQWLGGAFTGLAPHEVLTFRAVLIEEQFQASQ